MKLAIVGASARAAAFSALDAGHQVVAADLFADSDLADRCPATKIDCWPQGFRDWLGAQTIDAWLYTGGLENHAGLVDAMAQHAPLLGNGGVDLRRSRSAVFLAERFAERGLLFAEVGDQPPTERTGWLIKSSASAGGLGVADWHPAATPPTGGHYWQRRIDGLAISAAYVAAGGRVVLLGASEQLVGRRWTGAARYQYAGSVGPLAVTTRTERQLLAAGQLVAEACGLVGLVGVDFVLDEFGYAHAIEVNPRYTASMELVERVTGVSMIAAHVAACTTGVLPPLGSAAAGAAGKAYLFAQRDVVFRRPPGMRLADVPREATSISRGQPICTVLVNAKQYADAELLLEQQAGELERWLYGDQV